MPRKPQSEKAAETEAEGPVTRRSLRLSASSAASPELQKSRGKGNTAKSPAVAPVLPSEASPTSCSTSGTKGTETRNLGSSKTASSNKTKAKNETKEAEAATVEEQCKESTNEDSGASRKKRGRQTKGKSGDTDVKVKEVEKESETGDVENANDTNLEDLEDNQAATTSTGRQRRGRPTATPTSEKTSAPGRRGRGRGKVAAEAPSEADPALCKGIKQKRNDDDSTHENEEVDSSPKKQKTENVDEVNVEEKMEVDAQEVKETNDVSDDKVTETSEKTEQDPSIPSGDPKASECENLEKQIVSGDENSTCSTAADAADLKKNGPEQVDKTMVESDSLAVAEDAQETMPSSGKIADVLTNGTSDVLCSRKFAWLQGKEPSPSDLCQTFSAVSYNILADCHAQRDYTEPGSWIAKEHLAIKYRHDRLMKEIRFLDSDIICFQEVGTDYFTSVLKPALAELGYDGVYVPRYSTIYSEGEATFFHARSFNLESSQSLVLSQVAEREIDESDIEPDVKSSVKEAVQSHAVALLTRLKWVKGGATVTCANIHVAYDMFERQDKQCLQLACAIRELVKLAGGPDKPHFICGDFNSWPDSPPYQLVHDGHLSEKSLTALQSINTVSQSDGQLAPLVNYWSEGFQYSPANNLQSAYMKILGKEPLTSRFHDGVVRSVDYVWFSGNTLQVKGVMETVDEENIKGGVPNAIFPSDHLSLKVVFSFN